MLVNIEDLIRSLGIELDKNANLPEGISGQIEKIGKDEFGDDKYKISIQKNDHYYRKRFTMAHELGHYLFHRDKIGAGLDDNKMYRAMYMGGYGVSLEDEMIANRHAAVTLMPEESVMFYVNNGIYTNETFNYEKLVEVAKIFQVSPKALEIRIEGLFKTFRVSKK